MDQPLFSTRLFYSLEGFNLETNISTEGNHLEHIGEVTTLLLHVRDLGARQERPPQAVSAPRKDLPEPNNPMPVAGIAPPCQTCGNNQGMELIKWTVKETGELKSAWKCQACLNWHHPKT